MTVENNWFRFPSAKGGGWGLLLLACLAAGGCAGSRDAVRETPAPIRYEEPPPVTLLNYHQQLQRLSAQELARERSALAAQPASPANQVKLAMIHGQPRAGGDLSRALALLEAVLKSNEPHAAALHPLARLLADHYGERQRNDIQMDKLNQQNREAQRRADQLQEKLDALADIERSLPSRPRVPRSANGGQR